MLRAHDFAGISCQLFSGASLRKLCGKELAAPLAAHLEEIQAEKKSSSTSLENYGEEERSGQKALLYKALILYYYINISFIAILIVNHPGCVTFFQRKI